MIRGRPMTPKLTLDSTRMTKPNEREEAGKASTTKATCEQPTPSGAGRDIATLVQADIEARAKKGLATYGERLKPHNGRDALVDAYQEALDLCMYLRQAIEETS